MGRIKETRNKSLTRARKTGADKRRRERVQRRRLIALGLPGEEVEHMNSRRVRTLLKRPKDVVRRVAKS